MSPETTLKPTLSEEEKRKTIQERMVRNQFLAWWRLYGAVSPKEGATSGVIGVPANGEFLRPNKMQKDLQKAIVFFLTNNLPIRIRCCKPRQKGSSTIATAIIFHFLAKSPAGTDGVMICADEAGKSSLLKMFSLYAKHDKFFKDNPATVTSEKVVYANGNTLRTGSIGGVSPAVGFTNQCILCTEEALYDSPGDANIADAGEKVQNAFMSLPSQPGTISIEESTARSSNGVFYTRFMDAEPWSEVEKNGKFSEGKNVISMFWPFFVFDYPETEVRAMSEKEQADYIENMGADEYEYFQTVKRETGHTLNGRDMAWRKWALRELCGGDEIKFSRDFPYSSASAFSKSGSPRFSQKSTSILRQRAKLHPAKIIGNFTMQGDDAFSKIEPVTFNREIRESDALWWVYEEPIVGCKYVVVVDPCMGKINTGSKDPDNHGIQCWRAGYRCEHGRWHAYKMVAHCIQSDGRKPFCRLEPFLAEREIWKASRYYGGTNQSKIVIELPVDAGMNRSLAEKGGNLYIQTKRNAVEEVESRNYGYVQTNVTRPAIIADLAKRLNENFQADDGGTIDGGGIDIPDEWTISELENFVRKPDGSCSAGAGHHDDQTMCAAIACDVEAACTPYAPPTRKLDRWEVADMREVERRNGGGKRSGTW